MILDFKQKLKFYTLKNITFITSYVVLVTCRMDCKFPECPIFFIHTLERYNFPPHLIAKFLFSYDCIVI